MTGLLDDVAHCTRNLMRSLGFSATVVLLLAFAFAANASVFSVAWNVLYRPLPFPDADKLVKIDMHFIKEKNDVGVVPMMVDMFAKDAGPLAAIAAWRSGTVTLKGEAGDADMDVDIVRAEPKLFDLLGLHPLAGRLLTRDDASAPGTANLLVGQGFAESRFGSAADAIGKTLDLKDGSYHIVGVMPTDVAFARGAKLWLPLAFSAAELHEVGGFGALNAIARLAVPVADAEAALTAQLREMAAHIGAPEPNNFQAHLSPLRKLWSGGSETALNLLLLAVASILLVTGANVCNLHLVRLSMRRHEAAMLSALGATPARSLRLLAVEAAILVGTGAAIGLCGLPAGLKLLDHFGLLPQNTPFAVGFDGSTIGYVLAVAVIFIAAMTLAGIGLQRRASALHDSLKQGGARQTSGAGAQRLRSALIVAQIALTAALLIGAGLLVHSAHRLLSEDVGFDREHLIVAALETPGSDAKGDPAAHGPALALRERIAALPGVSTVGFSAWPPFNGEFWGSPFIQPGGTAEQIAVQIRNVDQNYFSALGQPILSGRAFNADEVGSNLPVAIVDAEFARRYFPNGNALGQHFHFTPWAQDRVQELTIVGIVGATKFRALNETDQRPAAYLPGPYGKWFMIRSAIDPTVIERSLRQIAHDVPGAKLGTVVSMNRQIADTLRDVTRLNQLLELLAAIALLLASVGLYAVMAYSVRTRTNEFGVRLALGAPHSRVQREVLLQGLRLVGIGLLIGLPLAYAFSHVIASQLYHTNSFDPATLTVVTVLIAAVGTLASAWPAYSAARVDPMTALRTE